MLPKHLFFIKIKALINVITCQCFCSSQALAVCVGAMAPRNVIQPAKAKAVKVADTEADKLKHDRSAMLTCLGKRVKNGTATEEEKMTLSAYQEQPRFSEIKNDLLVNYKKDKSCKWYSEYTNKIQKETSTGSTSVDGYATSFFLNCSSLRVVKHSGFQYCLVCFAWSKTFAH